MNFDHVNKISDFFRQDILPYLNNRMAVNDFAQYLTRMVDSPSCRWMRTDLKAFPLSYLVDPVAFCKKYQKKCVAFMATSNAQDGTVNMIYQISPDLHLLARLYNWVDQGEVKSYMTITITYHKNEDYVAFYDDNLSIRLSGNTDEKPAGFGGLLQNQSSMDNLMKCLQGNPATDEN